MSLSLMGGPQRKTNCLAVSKINGSRVQSVIIDCLSGCTLGGSLMCGTCACRAVLFFSVLFFRSWFNFKFLARNLDRRTELEPPPPAL